LQTVEIMASVYSGMTLAQRAIQRIRDEMERLELTQRDLAERLNCSQGRVAKILNGRVELRVDDLERLAQFVALPVTEVIRDRGLEFYAELAPTEVRMIERLRQRPHLMQGVLMLLEISGVIHTPPVPHTPKRKRGRPLNSERRES
jgi:transcriptional regulator with XRE-family HTH domain